MAATHRCQSGGDQQHTTTAWERAWPHPLCTSATRVGKTPRRHKHDRVGASKAVIIGGIRENQHTRLHCGRARAGMLPHCVLVTGISRGSELLPMPWRHVISEEYGLTPFGLSYPYPGRGYFVRAFGGGRQSLVRPPSCHYLPYDSRTVIVCYRRLCYIGCVCV